MRCDWINPRPVGARRQVPGIQTRTLRVMVLHFLLVLILLAAYGYACFSGLFHTPLEFWTGALLFALIVGAVTLLFYRQAYQPILKLLWVIQMVENGDATNALDPAADPSIAPQVAILNRLLEGLKASLDQKYALQMVKKQAEFDALQSQINPHFLYNTLESIRGQAILEGVDEIADMTEALSAFFRYSISQRGNIVTLEDELKNVDNYFAIQQYRFYDKFSLQKLLEDGDDVLKYRLPKLTIQPIVENAIYHGLETKIGRGTITIRVTTTEKRMIINVVDDGVGIEKSRLDAINEKLSLGVDTSSGEPGPVSRGIALYNVNQRIKLNFGEPYGLIIYSTPDSGTDVEISLPLIKDQL